MAVFNYIYNGINKCFDFLLNLTGVSFYAVVAIVLYLLVAIIGFIACLNSEEAQSLRALKRINKMCLKQAKNPKNNFYTNLNALIKKGNNRVSFVYKDFLKRQDISITKTLKDSTIYNGYASKQMFLDKAAIIISLMIFVFSLGANRAADMTTANVLFMGLTMPLLILFINFIIGSIVKKIQNNITEDLAVYGNFVSEVSYDMLEGNEDFLFNAESEFLKTKKGLKIKSKTASLRDLNRKSKIIEANTKKNNVVIAAGMCNTTDFEKSGRDLRDFDFLEDNLALVKEKEKIEEELRRAKWEVEENEQDLNKDIKTNKDELVKVRQNIKETNDEEIAKNLKRQEGFQIKLLDALEKLKRSQYQSYLETESKLKAEIAKIDEELLNKKNGQAKLITNEINNFAIDLKQDLAQVEKDVIMNSDKKEIFLETNKDDKTIETKYENIESLFADNNNVVIENSMPEKIVPEIVVAVPVAPVFEPIAPVVIPATPVAIAVSQVVAPAQTVDTVKAKGLSEVEQRIYERKQKLEQEEKQFVSEPFKRETVKPIETPIVEERKIVAETKVKEEVVQPEVKATVDASKAQTSSAAISEKKKNINNALTDLLDAMNKYQTKNKK